MALVKYCLSPFAGRHALSSIAALALLSAILNCIDPASAAVVIFDGFGDADLDNNGVSLGAYDVDLNGAGNGVPGDAWQPVQNAGADTIFADGVTIQEVQTVENASQRGVPWYFTAGFTAGSSGDPRVNAKILNDSAAFLPETNAAIGFTSNNTPGKVTVAAIDDGLALAMESNGRGSSAAAFFDENYSDGNQGRISLGPKAGDSVRVSFDFRVWMSAPRFNSQSEQHVPTNAELRFGLFQDTDAQLGMTNSSAGLGNVPVVWGEGGGLLRGGGTSAVGGDFDHGWFARMPIEDPDEATDKPVPNGASARVVEELNDNTDSNRAVMIGSQDNVVVPNSPSPNFVNLNYRKAYNLALSLTRHDDPAAVGAADAILATLTVNEKATGQSYSIQGFDAVGVAGVNDPDGGFESDSWDYFAIASSGSLDDFDWIIDNFTVEVLGSNAPIHSSADFDGDSDVDGADFLTWQRGLGVAGDLSDGDANRDGHVDDEDLTIWRENFGDVTSGFAVPESKSAISCFAVMVLTSQIARRRGPSSS
jgi:hypothetical protein